MPILTNPTDFPAVRAAIDTSLTAAALPDATIALDIYLGAAELYIISRDADAESRTGDAETHIKNATTYYLAALLIPAVPHLQEVSDRSIKYKRQADWDALEAQLRGRVEYHLAQVLEPSEKAPGRPVMFAVATGRRGC